MHTCTPFFAGVFSHAVSMLQSTWKWKWKQTTITVYGFTFTRCVVLCCVFFSLFLFFSFLLLNECCVFVIFFFVFWSFFPVGKNRMGFHHCITAMHPRSFFLVHNLWMFDENCQMVEFLLCEEFFSQFLALVLLSFFAPFSSFISAHRV